MKGCSKTAHLPVLSLAHGVHQTYDQGNAAKHVADVGLLCFAPNRRNIGLEGDSRR